MKPSKLLVLAAAAFAFSACAGGARRGASSGGSRPAWVEGESPKWTRAANVLGVGSGDDEESAADRARGEVSRVFSSAVSVDTTVDETESTVASGGRENASFSSLVAQKVRTASKKMLEGVEIVERWRDGATGRHYALAVLNKGKAMAAVAERTSALDDEAALWKKNLDAASSPFERAKAAAKLSAVLKGRLELENDRRVLGGGALPSGVDAAAAMSAAAKALADLDVVVTASGDGAEQLRTGVIAGLAASGLSAMRTAQTPDLGVEAAATVEPVQGGDPRWKWARAGAVISLKDAHADKVFARFDLSERAASADAGEARRRALDGLAKKAAERTAAEIEGFFQNQ